MDEIETPKESLVKDRMIPLSQWHHFHPWPPAGGLRHLVFHEKENGFSSVVVRAGRRVLIDEKAFFAWLQSQKKS